jgi:hypothetical protein
MRNLNKQYKQDTEEGRNRNLRISSRTLNPSATEH